MRVSKDHPRYKSLVVRERMARMMKEGVVSTTGLIAHGRGEAFDYLVGESTTESALEAEKAAIAMLLEAERPVISVNGNAAGLAAKELVKLAKVTGSRIEVNLFHRTPARMKLVVARMEKAGAKNVLGLKADARLPGIASERAKCTKEGIFSADVVLVPLEDGDRAEALVKAGKNVIVVDLNPLSRSAQAATITVVDELTRALPRMIALVPELSDAKDRIRILRSYDNERNLRASLSVMLERLESLAKEGKG
ncbi:MAG TPA: 4-phosphopantoate--beta-alanine ligase [Methanomassiliicoccales archaeon]|nr:4-phosphopantoate--beta-alanine ligase [Methanomassiliicoccales archaeon]